MNAEKNSKWVNIPNGSLDLAAGDQDFINKHPELFSNIACFDGVSLYVNKHYFRDKTARNIVSHTPKLSGPLPLNTTYCILGLIAFGAGVLIANSLLPTFKNHIVAVGVVGGLVNLGGLILLSKRERKELHQRVDMTVMRLLVAYRTFNKGQ